MRRRLAASAAVTALAVGVVGCALPAPAEPTELGENYPGTCMPGELSWPTDWLDALYGEDTDVIAGEIVALRLEYVNKTWAWRVRSAAQRTDWFGEQVDDPTFGYEALVTTRDHQLISSRDVTLTEAEQQAGSSAWSAAKESGEKWPSPLVIEMTRVMDNDRAMWRVTTCDTATNEFTTTLIP